MRSGAWFSRCREYRYQLWRRWSYDPWCLFLMLNPSTADAVENDPTVERCERRARSMGYGGLIVANLFALRSTDPRALKRHQDPVGKWNDRAILGAVRWAKGSVICAWGAHGKIAERSAAVVKLLEGAELKAIRVNRDGEPAHPLYLPYAEQPKPWVRS